MLDTIYVTRHGFRSNWVTDNLGSYSAMITSPTGIPSDPPLAAHGAEQAKELMAHLVKLDPKVDRIYSSPFYRCLETINPTAEALDLGILADNGVGEWYGVARFNHPSPASPELLHTFFPRVSLNHVPTIIPSTKGETIAQIHDRTAYALARIIADIDRGWAEEGSGPKAIIICSHAATNIAAGRALVGDENFDVKTGTCSLSTYRRRAVPTNPTIVPLPSDEFPIPDTAWRGGNGVGGGWDNVINGDCTFLKDGEERNWWFSHDEAWDSAIVKPKIGEIPEGGPGSVPQAGQMEAKI
ncbi:phosphoglycerate mutase-like protein [Choiromyces venosus 120613-1]|uniref:Phosphoglycerate mutase-like protein n=1 Tax=Choiromyces venosus 120613-1 TaxID=1336337 RepID=A0A3N4KA70_9PEZI|nr:phosphoglycerate mutase-like protein [Choiromyces venosus 120613-1]